MLSNARLPKQFQAEEANTSACLVNKYLPTAIECKTPNKVWTGSHANYEDLKIYGCPAYAHVNEGSQSLEKRSVYFWVYKGCERLQVMVSGREIKQVSYQ